ncbi:hypothetical protein EV194_103259 [Natronoflexus pectinivorans]|uniref:Uncharacterized protein n=2 Tax=Natronoflexus pectinivorans TaxID=682526 RepID=A0A4R2GL82_9BACT|nr:hypothetical protein EV194_103259 [Natronoflexus pectinivorans]
MLYRQNLLTMHFSKLSFDDFMVKVAGLIGNSLNETRIVEATGRFGYDETRIKEGEMFYRKVKQFNDAQEKVIQDKIKAHEERKKLHNLVRKQYMKMLQIARIAFDKDIIISKALQLEGPRETKLDDWMNQVSVFGNRLLGEERWISVLKKYGISKKDVATLLSDLDKLRAKALECEKLKNESKNQTAVKRKKVKELQEWVSDYLKIAKIALDEQPELFRRLRV